MVREDGGKAKAHQAPVPEAAAVTDISRPSM
jgi:hypothetical protein